jgi:hypothetical protein
VTSAAVQAEVAPRPAGAGALVAHATTTYSLPSER